LDLFTDLRPRLGLCYVFCASDTPCGAKEQSFLEVLGTIGLVCGRIDGGDEGAEGDRVVFVLEEHSLPNSMAIFILFGSRAWLAGPFLLSRLFRLALPQLLFDLGLDLGIGGMIVLILFVVVGILDYFWQLVF
jgi:hypothetical protein